MPDDVYQEVRDHFDNIDDTEVTSGRGAQGVKYKGKMFAMFSKGDLLLQFSENEVQEIIANDEGVEYPYSKDRVVIPVQKSDTWIKFAERSYEYVKNK